MALYRSHRGSLDESLKTTVIIRYLGDLRTIIHDDFFKEWKAYGKDNPLNMDFDIRIECNGIPSLLDPRCGWYTQTVTADLIEKGKFRVVGFLSEPLSF